MLWLALMACALDRSDTDDTAAPAAVVPAEIAVRFEPEVLDFGEVGVFTPQTRTLLVHNEGNVDVFFSDLSTPEGHGFVVATPSSLSVDPGGMATVNLTWTPSGVGEVSSKLTLAMAASGGDTFTEEVALSGSGHGSLVVTTPRAYDFGEVKVGCDAGLSISVSNAGDEAITVEALELDGQRSFSMKLGDDEDLPWVMEPFSTRDVAVGFSPDDVGQQAAVLSFRSGSQEWSTALEGVGAVDGEATITYTVGELAKAAALWHVADCAMYYYEQPFVSALPTLFETLNDAGASYRMTFLRTTDGIPQSSEDYIDETFTVSDATATATEMIAGGCTMNNDRSFDTLLAGAAIGDSWLNEDDLWEEAKLSLIAINNDNDASTLNSVTGVERAQKLRDDPDLVTFHAIGEHYTGACASSVPFAGYIEAVEATDGIFLNLCDTDWTGHMEKLAAVIMNGSTSIFPLDGTPLASSVSVKIDGITESDGWEYDEGFNAVIFDDDAYPEPGAILEITYMTSSGC